MKRVLPIICVAVLASFLCFGFAQVGTVHKADTGFATIGFCELQATDCGADCFCSSHSGGSIVPAWCCPDSPCFGNIP